MSSQNLKLKQRIENHSSMVKNGIFFKRTFRKVDHD